MRMYISQSVSRYIHNISNYIMVYNDNDNDNDNENFIPDTFVHKNIHWSILTFLRYINTIL